MSKQPSSQPESDHSVDKALDALLAQQVRPSAQFTDRVIAEIQQDKVVQGPWQKMSHWIGGAATAAAAIAVAVGLSIVYTPQSDEAHPQSAASNSQNTNPFLEGELEPEFVEETPESTIDTLLDDNDALNTIDALLDQPQLIDLNILLES